MGYQTLNLSMCADFSTKMDRNRQKRKEEKKTQKSCVTSHVSGIMYNMSHVTGHLSHVTCH